MSQGKTVSLCRLQVLDGKVDVIESGLSLDVGVAQVSALNRIFNGRAVAFLVSEYGPGYGAWRVLLERARQINEEGYDPEHDAAHVDGELLLAAAAYAMSSFGEDDNAQTWWPWEPEGFKPSTPGRDLERAGALIAAEIDRLGASGNEMAS